MSNENSQPQQWIGQMDLIFIPTSVLTAILIGVSFFCLKLADNNRKTLAWWLFFVVSMPALSSIFMLLSFDLPDTASREGVLLLISSKIGILTAVVLVSSIGLAFLSERPLGMLAVLVLFSNINYISNSELLPLGVIDVLPIFFASVCIVVLYFFVESQVEFGAVRKRSRIFQTDRIAEISSLQSHTDLEDSMALKSGNVLQDKAQFQAVASKKENQAPENIFQLTIACALIGAGLTCVVILAFSISGGEQKAYFAILNNPSHLAIPALLGAAMGIGYALIRKK